jgi:hypothetical protein
MKQYTDIEQSKKLTEILPIESADMCFNTRSNMPPLMVPYSRFNEFFNMETPAFLIPCWSLSALLSILPVSCDDGRHCLALINSNPNGEIEWLCSYEDDSGNLMMECYSGNQIDACYEMVLKLHEQKVL